VPIAECNLTSEGMIALLLLATVGGVLLGLVIRG
jgi:hypothetical protein